MIEEGDGAGVDGAEGAGVEDGVVGDSVTHILNDRLALDTGSEIEPVR